MKYLCDPHILPTNTCPPDLTELEKRTASVLDFAPEIQLDAADGVFAPVTSWPYLEGQWQALEAMAARGRGGKDAASSHRAGSSPPPQDRRRSG
jgi:hypothetical protein